MRAEMVGSSSCDGAQTVAVFDDVVAEIAGERVDVGALSAHQTVVAGAAVQGIHIDAADQDVVVSAAGQEVGSGTADQDVVAGSAVENVGLGTADGGVVGGKAGGPVHSGRARLHMPGILDLQPVGDEAGLLAAQVRQQCGFEQAWALEGDLCNADVVEVEMDAVAACREEGARAGGVFEVVILHGGNR